MHTEFHQRNRNRQALPTRSSGRSISASNADMVPAIAVGQRCRPRALGAAVYKAAGQAVGRSQLVVYVMRVSCTTGHFSAQT